MSAVCLALYAPSTGRGEIVPSSANFSLMRDKKSPVLTQPPTWLGWGWGRKHSPGPRPPGSYLRKERTGKRMKEQKSLGGKTKASRIPWPPCRHMHLCRQDYCQHTKRVTWHHQDPYLRAQVKLPHSGKLCKVPSCLLDLTKGALPFKAQG